MACERPQGERRGKRPMWTIESVSHSRFCIPSQNCHLSRVFTITISALSYSHTIAACVHPAFYIPPSMLPPASHCASLSHASPPVSPRRKNCRLGFHGLAVHVCDGAKRCPGHEDQGDSRRTAVRLHIVLPQDQGWGASALQTPRCWRLHFAPSHIPSLATRGSISCSALFLCCLGVHASARQDTIILG